MPDAPGRKTRLLAWALLIAGMVAFAVGHTLLARWKALGLMSEWGFDLTFFHNLVWNVTHGHGYTQSATYHEPPGIFGETHFEPLLLLAALPYKLVPRLETLFAVQSSLLALGAWGVYRLVRQAPAHPLLAAGAAWVYLLWWPLWRMAMADIRPLTWALPLLLLLAAALREGRHTEAFAWGLLACMSREEVPLLVAFLCLGTLLWRDRPRKTAVTLVIAALGFAVVTTLLRSNVTFYIQPGRWLEALLNGGGGDSGGWGQSAGDLLGVRIAYLREWLLPAALGALAAPELLLGALPLFAYLFSQPHEWASWEGPYVHHAAPGAGIVAAAAAVGWPRLLRRLPAFASALVLVVVLAAEVWLLQQAWEPVLAPEVTPWLEGDPRVLAAHRLADQVPDDASVAADWHTVHLFSGREQVYSYHQEAPEFDALEPRTTPLDEPLLPRPALSPEWLLLNDEDAAWHRRAAAAGYTEVDRGGDWRLLRRPPKPG